MGQRRFDRAKDGTLKPAKVKKAKKKAAPKKKKKKGEE